MRYLSTFLVALLVATIPAAHSQSTTSFKLQGSLSAKRIAGFGLLEPPANKKKVRLRLLVATPSGFEEVARKKVALHANGDSDNDGRRESRYGGSFPSPAAETCKIVARFPGTRRRAPARRVIALPCNRPDFPTGDARLRDVSSGTETTIAVEIADNDELRAFGLMYKRRLAADRGMAFLYNSPSSGGYWMKNTLIPLSIAFFDASGVILRIMDMEPCTRADERSGGCPVYDPETSYMGTLEVNQGAFDGWGIDEGDVIVVTDD